jgi:hypothetical protein
MPSQARMGKEAGGRGLWPARWRRATTCVREVSSLSLYCALSLWNLQCVLAKGRGRKRNPADGSRSFSCQQSELQLREKLFFCVRRFILGVLSFSELRHPSGRLVIFETRVERDKFKQRELLFLLLFLCVAKACFNLCVYKKKMLPASIEI